VEDRGTGSLKHPSPQAQEEEEQDTLCTILRASMFNSPSFLVQ